MYQHDNRTVVTLDAGGTNFVFGAMRGCEFITEPLRKPSNADDLDRCLATLVEGFGEIISRLDTPPVAISFAFPGPADYPHGIIGGNLPNFPSFRDGVALGPFLEMKFGIPVFINNDGNLFAYGEAMVGALPRINEALAAAGSQKRYRNLLGVTFGTGFGCGVVINGELLMGDNAAGGDVWCFRNSLLPEYIVEESVSIRAVKRIYRELSGDDTELTPKDICDIADGKRPGDAEARRKGRFGTLEAVLHVQQQLTLQSGEFQRQRILPLLLRSHVEAVYYPRLHGPSVGQQRPHQRTVRQVAVVDRSYGGG